MYNIAVIGAGNLGRRHLQGLSHSSLNGTLHVVDPFASSLEAAKAMLAEAGDKAPLAANLRCHSDLSDLPALDLAIIATTADIRMEVVRALCDASPPKYLVLEKVLFQRADDYDAMQALLKKHNITAWVNCPRRIMPVYQELAAFFSDDPILRMELFGGEWGIGCNSIHFIDMLAFLTRSTDVQIDGQYLDGGVLQSKRKGYVEFSGTLSGKLGGATFALTALAGSERKHLISLHGRSKSVFIDETEGKMWVHGRSSPTLEKFVVPYQSQLTGQLAEAILHDGSCQLTSYTESAMLHQPLLRALAEHVHGTASQKFICPVT